MTSFNDIDKNMMPSISQISRRKFILWQLLLLCHDGLFNFGPVYYDWQRHPDQTKSGHFIGSFGVVTGVLGKKLQGTGIDISKNPTHKANLIPAKKEAASEALLSESKTESGNVMSTASGNIMSTEKIAKLWGLDPSRLDHSSLDHSSRSYNVFKSLIAPTAASLRVKIPDTDYIVTGDKSNNSSSKTNTVTIGDSNDSSANTNTVAGLASKNIDDEVTQIAFLSRLNFFSSDLNSSEEKTVSIPEKLNQITKRLFPNEKLNPYTPQPLHSIEAIMFQQIERIRGRYLDVLKALLEAPENKGADRGSNMKMSEIETMKISEISGYILGHIGTITNLTVTKFNPGQNGLIMSGVEQNLVLKWQQVEQISKFMNQNPRKYYSDDCNDVKPEIKQVDPSTLDVIMVTGGAGFVGSHIAEALLLEGRTVVVFDMLNSETTGKGEKEENVQILKAAAEKWKKKNSCKSKSKIVTFSSAENQNDEKNTHAENEEPKIHFVHGDMRDKETVAETIEKYKVTACVHVAGLVDDRRSVKFPEQYIDINVQGTCNLLQCLGNSETCKKVVQASTRSVFGQVPEKLKDAMLDENFPRRPVNPYGASKVASDAIAHAYSHLSNMQITLVRIFATYGPRGRPDMMPRILMEKIRNGEEILKFGEGDATRTWVYIEDIVSAFLTCLKTEIVQPHYNDAEKQPQFSPYFDEFNTNSSDGSVSLNTLIETAEKVVGKKAIIKNVPVPPGDANYVGHSDSRKFREKLNWTPKVSLLEGMTKYLKTLDASEEACSKERSSSTDSVRDFKSPAASRADSSEESEDKNDDHFDDTEEEQKRAKEEKRSTTNTPVNLLQLFEDFAAAYNDNKNSGYNDNKNSVNQITQVENTKRRGLTRGLSTTRMLEDMNETLILNPQKNGGRKKNQTAPLNGGQISNGDVNGRRFFTGKSVADFNKYTGNNMNSPPMGGRTVSTQRGGYSSRIQVNPGKDSEPMRGAQEHDVNGGNNSCGHDMNGGNSNSNGSNSNSNNGASSGMVVKKSGKTETQQKKKPFGFLSQRPNFGFLWGGGGKNMVVPMA